MFATQLKLLRQSKEMNQVQLASKLGVTKQTVCNWENDNIMPSVELLIRIADFFNVSTDYLLGRYQPEYGDILLLDVTGLKPRQLEHIKQIVDDLREITV